MFQFRLLLLSINEVTERAIKPGHLFCPLVLVLISIENRNWDLYIETASGEGFTRICWGYDGLGREDGNGSEVKR